MNDLQLLAQLAMQYWLAKGGTVDDALDKAEGLMDKMIDREFKHSMKHMNVAGGFNDGPVKGCYHCTMMERAMEKHRRAGLTKGLVQ